jgi:hypothetical protein
MAFPFFPRLEKIRDIEVMDLRRFERLITALAKAI